jgi:hypothetical protein
MLFRESGSRKFKKGLDVVLVRIERSQRGQIGGACAPFRNKVRSRAPGELGLPVFYGNYVRNHARVPAVSVCERMDFRNKLVMESNHAFVDWECLMIESIFRVGEKLGNTLYDFCGITSDVQFIRPIFARPFPNLIEHFAVKRADVELLQRVAGRHGSAAERPLSSL